MSYLILLGPIGFVLAWAFWRIHVMSSPGYRPAKRDSLRNSDDLETAARSMGWRIDWLAHMGGVMGIAYLDRPDGRTTHVSSLDRWLNVDGWRDYLLDESLRERV